MKKEKIIVDYFIATPDVMENNEVLSDTNKIFTKCKSLLQSYLGDTLYNRELRPEYAVSMLAAVFGKSILYDIDGFVNYALENKLSKEDIQITLAHDLGGALRFDDLMLPRVTDYKKESLLYQKKQF
jgi:hypothetical protein